MAVDYLTNKSLGKLVARVVSRWYTDGELTTVGIADLQDVGIEPKDPVLGLGYIRTIVEPIAYEVIGVVEDQRK